MHRTYTATVEALQNLQRTEPPEVRGAPLATAALLWVGLLLTSAAGAARSPSDFSAPKGGQREAAIREHEAGLTLIHIAFRNAPVAVEIDRGYSDQLWGKDVGFENLSKAALVINHSDDTTALRQAIATHRALYFPMGRYKVSDTLLLRPDTVLIGLHPSLTQLFLEDDTPAYADPGAPRAQIETPRGGE